MAAIVVRRTVLQALVAVCSRSPASANTPRYRWLFRVRDHAILDFPERHKPV